MASPVDESVLERLREDVGGEEEVLRDLVETFLSETPRLVAALVAAAQAKRWPDVHKEAHVLKSTAATFGAQQLAQLARDMEADTYGGGHGGPLAKQAEAIAAEWARVQAHLQARLSLQA